MDAVHIRNADISKIYDVRIQELLQVIFWEHCLEMMQLKKNGRKTWKRSMLLQKWQMIFAMDAR